MTAYGGQGQRVQTELGSKSLNASEQAAVAEFRWQEMHSHIPSMHWPPTWSLTCRKGRDRCPSPPLSSPQQHGNDASVQSNYTILVPQSKTTATTTRPSLCSMLDRCSSPPPSPRPKTSSTASYVSLYNVYNTIVTSMKHTGEDV